MMEKELNKHFKHEHFPKVLKDAMLYSLEAGGKRLRPVLLAASYGAFQTGTDKILTSAVALEMIHTYSLIHDDLPAMDNDDYRRGKLTNHKAFNEAIAILAGDALLTYSFEIIANDPLLSSDEKVTILQMLSRASGPHGMVAGQIYDMEAEDKAISLEQLENIHALKTGELVGFAVKAGAFLGNASEEQLKHLEKFAYYLGILFQVQDDILDIEGDEEKLGKSVGSDIDQNKSTYPKLLGLNGAKKLKLEYANKAKESLKMAQANTDILMNLIDHFSQRDH
ncbi:polyprenyl synthetase family protein [Virgibacillus soli]|uniref:Polyprenyl synthetase family protein n=2 Tax=Paracerasibacillus soli TaxID=480284 RepID=A0ABU5CPV0_9BACI|nr:farnesyl diphosphate synthase [Virgibacillus soli]MDY0408396.1 polyprenyl synthetase family protein [Virgibacillus soli]